MRFTAFQKFSAMPAARLMALPVASRLASPVTLPFALQFALLLVLLALQATVANAAPTFPPLSGRVVDNANLLSPAAEQRIEAQLAAHETKTTNQVVVTTLADLQGYAIEDYGYQLAREWGIGQKDKDNGALLIIAPNAPNQRRLRIEVGYGLEGSLTDVMSNDIIHNTIAPLFRSGDFDGGTEAAVTRMLAILEGDAAASEIKPAPSVQDLPVWVIVLAVVFGALFIFAMSVGGVGGVGNGIQRGGFGMPGGLGRGGGGFGGGGGGGFGGGGGGFGGGGASGGW